MTAAEVLSACARLGVECRVTSKRLEWRPDGRLTDPLREALAAHRRAIAAELRRDAAVSVAWDRLQAAYLAAGCPAGWLTPDVRFAEHVAETLWVSARTDPDDDARFSRALCRWEGLALEAVSKHGS